MNVESKSFKGARPDGPKKSATNLTGLLLQCRTGTDPMLSMLEWLCDKLMEAEISAKIGADKSEHSTDHQSYRSGYRPRRFDSRIGTIYLMVPKMRQDGKAAAAFS